MALDVEELELSNFTTTPVANRLIAELVAPIIFAEEAPVVVLDPVYVLLKMKVLLPELLRAATIKQRPV